MERYMCKGPGALCTRHCSCNSTYGLRERERRKHLLLPEHWGTEEENGGVTEGTSSKLALYPTPNILVTGGQCKNTGQSQRPATYSWLRHL